MTKVLLEDPLVQRFADALHGQFRPGGVNRIPNLFCKHEFQMLRWENFLDAFTTTSNYPLHEPEPHLSHFALAVSEVSLIEAAYSTG
jgi:hypothetical protein